MAKLFYAVTEGEAEAINVKFRVGGYGINIHEMQAVGWTKEPPTVPGHYMAKRKGQRAEFVDVEPDEFGHNIVVMRGGYTKLFSEFTHWLGPIPLIEPDGE